MQKNIVGRHFVIAIFVLLITLQVLWQIDMIQIIFGQSPSFERQEIIDGSDDWIFWKGSASEDNQVVTTHDNEEVEVDKAQNSSECEIDDDSYISPDIQSVSYFSDGKNLTAVMWLTSPLDESLLNDTIDNFQEQLHIRITHNNNHTLEELTDVKKARVPFTLGQPPPEENSTILSGNEARNMSYTNTNRGAKITQIWTIKGDKAYEIEYSASLNKYDEYLPIIQRMIDTFEIMPSSRESSTSKNETNLLDSFPTYESSEIRIGYPSDWSVNSTDNNGVTNILFLSPFEESWRRITFTMAIDIDSVHDAGMDYRVIYSRGPNNTWSKEVTETSAYDKTRLLEENNDSVNLFDKKDNSSALFSIDLSKVSSPERYKAVFYITDYFLKNHRFCTLIDTTNWVPIPPPQFTIKADPSHIVLRPPEEKSIQIQLTGNTDLQSEALLAVTNDNYDNDIQLDIFPSNKTSIPPGGSGTYTLNIKASDTAKPRSNTIPINATISFPTSVTNRGGETFTNNQSVSITELSNVTLTVLTPYTPQEHLSNFTQTLTPITTLTSFIVGVGSAVTPILFYMYRKRKKNEQKNSST
jgi:hypothetical protein